MQRSITSSELPEGKENHRKRIWLLFLPQLTSFFFSNCCHAIDLSMERGGKIAKSLYLHGFVQSFSKISRFVPHALYCKGDKNKRIKTNKHLRIRSFKPFQHFCSAGVYSEKCNSTNTVQTSRVSDWLSINVSMPSAHQLNILKALKLPHSKCHLPKHPLTEKYKAQSLLASLWIWKD